jgi:predicted MFS family arabinose efflux permease
VIGALLLATLAVTETRVPHPMLRPELLRSRRRVGGLVAMAAFYGAMLGLFFLMVQFLEEQLGFSPLLTGIAFLPLPGSVFTLSRLTPRLVARFGRAPFLIIGPTGVSISLLLLTRLHADSHYFWAAFPSIWLMGLAGGVFFMPLTSVVLEGVAHEHAGSASGLLQTMQQLGGAVGLAVIASVFAGHVHAGFADGADAGFTAALVLGLVGLVAAITAATSRESVG